MKKLKYLAINVFPFILIALYIFLPLFVLKGKGEIENYTDKLVYGFNLLGGLSEKSGTERTYYLVSEAEAFAPIFLLLTIFVLDKVKGIGNEKSFFNVICATASFVYIFLVSGRANVFLMDNLLGYLSFYPYFGFTIVIIFNGLLVIYYIFDLVKIIKESKAK